MNEQTLFEPLSRREREILALLCENLRDQEIADRLFVALSTVKWYNRQIFNKLGVENRREAVKRARALGLLAQDGAAEPAPAKHNLPSQLTPFVGRSRELAEIDGWLAHPHTRLLTVLAPGGMGKTRLALEAAERALSRYADGVFFVPLAALTSTDHVVPALAEAMGLQFAPDGRTPEQQLADFLRRKHLLLVIDNFEHLLDAAPLIAELLTAAPKVTALITSRERLNLNGEVVYPLAGLHYPDADSEEEPLRFGAVELFIECALRANPRFVTHDSAVIGQLCRRVQGMPLAIELAAAWSGALSIAEIDAEINRSADFLSTAMANVPERQRSVRAVFEAAWARLDDDAQRVFRRMSVFRGGCTREAAQAVTGASIQTLAALVDKALLWRDPQTGRYDIHELLRQYAEAELECAGETETTKQAHQEYYAALAAKWGAVINRDKMLEAFAVFDADFDNVRQAFARAIAEKSPNALEPFAQLDIYYHMRGYGAEGRATFAAAVEALEPDESVALALMLEAQLVVRPIPTDVQWIHDTAKRALTILERVDHPRVLYAKLGYAGALEMSGEIERAIELNCQILDVARKGQDPVLIANALYGLGMAKYQAGAVDEAIASLSEAHRIASSVGHFRRMVYCLQFIAEWTIKKGDVTGGRRLVEELAEISYKIRFEGPLGNLPFLVAYLTREQRDWRAAYTATQDLLRFRQCRNYAPSNIFSAHALVAEIAIRLGNLGDAVHHLQEASAILKDTTKWVNIEYWWFVAALFFVNIGDYGRVITLCGKICDGGSLTDALRDSSVLEQETITSAYYQCREALPPEEFEAAWARGQTLTNEEAIALVAEALR
jgi:predicted ATPase/DNA-binding CsgD family transcriptional regulator